MWFPLTHEHESVLGALCGSSMEPPAESLSLNYAPDLTTCMFITQKRWRSSFPGPTVSGWTRGHVCHLGAFFLRCWSESRWERGACVCTSECVLKLGLTTGSSHISFLSPPLSNLLCFLLPHDCRFLMSVALASAVFFPHSLVPSSSCFFFNSFNPLFFISSLFLDLPLSPCMSLMIQQRYHFLLLSPSAHLPTSFSVFRSNSWFPCFFSIKISMLSEVLSAEWLSCQVVWCIRTFLPYTH